MDSIIVSNPAENKSLDLTVYQSQSRYQPTLDDLVATWMHAKVTRTGSETTERSYKENMTHFRDLLKSMNLDLDADPPLIAWFAQGWASKATRKATVAAATYNQRLFILSSFYQYAIKHRALKENPINMVEKRPVNAKDYAQPLDKGDVQVRLQKIDRSTLPGLRDYALLSVALSTGRRAHELAGMKWGDIRFSGDKAIVIWPHCKGGKVMSDELKPRTTIALVAYVQAIYGNIDTIKEDAPIWLSFARNASAGGGITTQAISDICKKRLGTSKVHSTRHSFAVAMENAGAKLSEIGDRLGHASLKTTSDYMKRLHSMENPYGEQLEKMFGI